MNSLESTVELTINGRDGELKYKNGNKHISAYVELSGTPEYDLLVSNKDISKWSNGASVTGQEKERILKAFKEWASKTNTRCQWQ